MGMKRSLRMYPAVWAQNQAYQKYRYRENRFFQRKNHVFSNKEKLHDFTLTIFCSNLYLIMMNHWSSGIRVARGGSAPTALIRSIENLKLRQYYIYGCQTAPFEQTRQDWRISGVFIIPVYKKPVFFAKFYWKR